MKRFFTTITLIVALSFVLGLGSSIAADKEVTIGFQLVYNPAASAIIDGTFEKVPFYIALEEIYCLPNKKAIYREI